jgi:uncharacterized protein
MSELHCRRSGEGTVVTERIRRALVTGASAGIGEAFARRLAAEQVEVVLVARRDTRLRALAGQLPAGAEVLPADLATDAGLATVASRLAATSDPVDLLVNNAGFGGFGPFAELPDASAADMVAVNVAALTRLSRAVLPQLLERGSGGIINVGSTAGYRPGPGNAVYHATKAYVRSFTEAVHEEVRRSGVHVMLLAPGFTATEFQSVAGVREGAIPGPLLMNADEVVEAGLEAFAARRVICVPGAASRATAVGTHLVPRRVASRFTAMVSHRIGPR